jgi:hypothetical protein
MVKMTCSLLSHQSDFSLNYEKCIYHIEVDLVCMLKKEKKKKKVGTKSQQFLLNCFYLF